MNRQVRAFWSLVLIGAILSTGCKPTQPFYLREDGDLSHYLDVATQIEYPDVEQCTLEEVANTLPPLTLENMSDYEMWDLTLEEATRITLCNSQVMRQLGGVIQAGSVEAPLESISRIVASPVALNTTYDPALVESATGTALGSQFSGTGVEAALSEFDARLDASVFWQKNRTPQNRPDAGDAAALFPPIFAQDLGNFSTGITKTAATGSTFSFRNNTTYEGSNVPVATRPLISAWSTNFEATAIQPLLQGYGVQYNRIAGPLSFEQYAAGAINPFDGVIIARIRTDQSLADFENGVRNLMRDVELAYWDLYFRYRDLDAQKEGRDSALETWRNVHAKYMTGARGGSADREAQARSQYFLFRSQVERALNSVFQAENRLRYLMGIAMSDGRLIRPADEPTTAHVGFPWCDIHIEALARRVELRKQKWEIKRRELELVAARNHLLPRLDAVGTYRWQGLGDDLIDPSRNNPNFNQPGSNAFAVLTGGQFQEWQIGLQGSLPIGFRQSLSTVRHHELLLARERAVLQDLELEVSHQLGHAIRTADLNYQLMQTNFNRRVAAQSEVDAVNAAYEAERATLDLLLDAQRRRAEAESAYYRSVVDFNQALMEVHYRKGSLLDYNGVYLAEGPWPGKAYFDALRRARSRDAALFLNYGYTRPTVFSRGPIDQGCSSCEVPGGGPGHFEPVPDEVEQMPPIEELPPVPQESGGNGQARGNVREIGPVLEQRRPISASYEAEAAGPMTEAVGPQSQAIRRRMSQQSDTRQRSQPLTAESQDPLTHEWQDFDERQANHPAAQTAANAAVGSWAER